MNCPEAPTRHLALRTLQVQAGQISAIEIARRPAIARERYHPPRTHVPEAEGRLVHDPHHLGRMLSKAVDTARRSEDRCLAVREDDHAAGMNPVRLRGRENLPPVRQAGFHALRAQRRKTSRAWAIKEMFRDFWTSPTVEEVRAFLARWKAGTSALTTWSGWPSAAVTASGAKRTPCFTREDWTSIPANRACPADPARGRK